MFAAVTKREKISRSPLVSESLRKCSGCKRELAPVAFARCQKNKDGLHSHCRECRSTAKRAAYAQRPEAPAAAHRRRAYGLDAATFAALVAKQGNSCAICREDMGSGYGRHIDHDHATGRVRELLCGNCNRALGGAMDNPELLRAMAAYIERHRC